ncbi:uncharacterized protein MELLADRAFT_123532 [Melampsora larici-populina 98AG31]|uniref:Secreted protein n=1 Tax=Melampsora larici-populina (strain 98AG31 / pathotype 3-4-7) TaxID=747676 RepID=F4RK43_MELLP|nr:uncharacterized protein MELLADRAFT_123532 [Melampsora larici-populina 98AG31]EGG07034.1 secreted protein [Melampsora larici-populina 98AG31]
MKYAPGCVFLWVLVLASTALANLGTLSSSISCKNCGNEMDRSFAGMCQTHPKCSGWITEHRRCRREAKCTYYRVMNYTCNCGHADNAISEHPHGEQGLELFCDDHKDQEENAARYNAEHNS